MEFGFSHTVLFFLALCTFNFYIGKLIASQKGIGYPPFIFCVIWTLVLLMHLFFRNTYMKDIYPISEKGLIVYTLGGVVVTVAGLAQFAFSFYWSKLFKSEHENNKVKTNVDRMFQVRIGCTLISLLLLPLYIMSVLRIAEGGISDNLLFNIRYEMVINEVDIGPAIYAQMFAMFTMTVQFLSLLQYGKKTNTWLFVINLIIVIVYTFFSSGRGYYLFIVAVLFGIQVVVSQVSKKFVLIAFGIFLSLFITVGILLNKVNINANSQETFVSASMIAIGLYVVVPLNAFDFELTRTSIWHDNGANTLRFFQALAEKTGLYSSDLQAKKLVQEFVFVPYPCNVYTIYSPYFRDFGLLITFIFLFIIICFHSWLFHKAIAKKNWAIIAYSLLVFPLIFSFFQDQYFSLLSTWIQFSLLIAAYFLAEKFLSKSYHD